MVPYDPKNWWRVFFSFEGTALRTVLYRSMWLGVLTGVLCLMHHYKVVMPPKPKPAADSVVKPEDQPLFTLFYFPEVPTLVHTVIGFVVGLLIVFRTNSSYDRFWEGRKLWGAIVNNSRNLARGGAVFAGQADELARLITGYVLSVMHNLRGENEMDDVKELVPAELFARAGAAGNPPTILASGMSRWIQLRLAEGKLNPEMARTLETYVASMLDCQGGCERILKTPIPFVYAVHIKQLLFFYLITLPLALVPTMSWFAIPTAIVIAFGLLGIEEAGVEIEDPFGTDPNDLPLDDICKVIARDAKALAE